MKNSHFDRSLQYVLTLAISTIGLTYDPFQFDTGSGRVWPCPGDSLFAVGSCCETVPEENPLTVVGQAFYFWRMVSAPLPGLATISIFFLFVKTY